MHEEQLHQEPAGKVSQCSESPTHVYALRGPLTLRVLAEALAARLPVVAVESAASREVLGGSGYLTAANAEALAAGLQAALGRNGSIQSAVHLASSRYTVAEQTARILDLYGEMLTVGAA